MTDALEAAKAVIKEYCSENCEQGECDYENHVIARFAIEQAERREALEIRLEGAGQAYEMEKGASALAEAAAESLAKALREVVDYGARLGHESHLNGCTDTADGSLECICDDPYPMARAALAYYEEAKR